MVSLNEIRELGLQWEIGLARNGDGDLLSATLRNKERLDGIMANDRLRKLLIDFLAGVVDGNIKLPKRRHKKTYLSRKRQYQREWLVLMYVEGEMGKRRNPVLRARYTRQYCEQFGTTPGAVEAYRALPKSRRGPIPI
jgi:hypothetical protein